MMHHLYKASAARRGITLVELIVASAIMVVVIGLGLGIASSTEKAGQRITKRQAAILYAQTSLQQVADAATGAIDPEALNSVTNRTPLAPVLTQDELGIMRYVDMEGPTLVSELFRAQKSDAGATFLAAQIQPLAETARGAVGSTLNPIGGSKPDGFTPSLEFAYASAPAPGQAAAYAPQWTAPGLPDLIRITIRVQFDAQEENAIELQTAVVPGFVRTVSAAPAPVEPAAPAAPAAETAPTTPTQEPAA